ncbi:hypothetical protein [Schnuerera sp.]|uniref:hypothetical protein n=1 Tax=Schnuerera sp. TaxID=2794844 RepID=UPI002B798B89|nr:hypothetical protein [Schnuerera sp.]HSH35238.1 hypothetical protein [Schnuerera sp.]
MEPLAFILAMSAIILLFVSLRQMYLANKEKSNDNTVEDFVSLIYNFKIRDHVIQAFIQMYKSPSDWTGYIVKSNGKYSVWTGNEWYNRRLYYGNGYNERDAVYNNFSVEELRLLDEGVKIINQGEKVADKEIQKLMKNIHNHD